MCLILPVTCGCVFYLQGGSDIAVRDSQTFTVNAANGEIYRLRGRQLRFSVTIQYTCQQIYCLIDSLGIDSRINLPSL